MKKAILIRVLVVMIVLMPIFVLIFNNCSYAKSEPVSYNYISVQIEEGDTITSIAREYLSQTDFSLKEYSNEIIRLNRLSSDNVKAGAFLMIPVAA